MERGAPRGGERASIAILHRTEIDTGTAGVTGVPGGTRAASRGFLYFSRKHYELVRKYLRRMALSYAEGFARRLPTRLPFSFSLSLFPSPSPRRFIDTAVTPPRPGYRVSPKLILDVSENRRVSN